MTVTLTSDDSLNHSCETYLYLYLYLAHGHGGDHNPCSYGHDPLSVHGYHHDPCLYLIPVPGSFAPLICKIKKRFCILQFSFLFHFSVQEKKNVRCILGIPKGNKKPTFSLPHMLSVSCFSLPGKPVPRKCDITKFHNLIARGKKKKKKNCSNK